MEKQPLNSFDVLQGHKYMNLTSFYAKSGRAVTTPVWFVGLDDNVYVMTTPSTYKVKRIQGRGDVEICPADPRGKPLGGAMAATARLVNGEREADLEEQVTNAFKRKYGLLYRLLDIPRMFGLRKIVFIELRNM